MKKKNESATTAEQVYQALKALRADGACAVFGNSRDYYQKIIEAADPVAKDEGRILHLRSQGVNWFSDEYVLSPAEIQYWREIESRSTAN